MTIIMVLHDELAYGKLALQSIRMFADVENVSVVIADNGSGDALGEWAKEQEDITYVYFEEGQLPFGQVVNAIRRELCIEDDLLVMDGHYMLTPHALSRMQELLHDNDAIGAVGGVANSFPEIQKQSQAADYEAAILWADKEYAPGQEEYVLGLCPEIMLVRAETAAQLGGLDETLSSQEYVMRDYGFRMILKDWKLRICKGALFWDIRGNGPYHTAGEEEEGLLEKKWGMHYFNIRYNANLVGMITEEREVPIAVLEVGCDCGATLLEIRNRYPNAAVYGVELNEKAAMVASHVAQVQVGNIEEEKLDLSGRTLDYIILGDVLEHLHDPLKTIRYCRRFLKEDGHILASIPNLMHISVMEDLLNGNFTYTETGLLDKTHIHLFTYNEIVKMFQAGGYEVENVRTIVFPMTPGQEALIGQLSGIGSGTARFMYEAYQYVVRARKG